MSPPVPGHQASWSQNEIKVLVDASSSEFRVHISSEFIKNDKLTRKALREPLPANNCKIVSLSQLRRNSRPIRKKMFSKPGLALSSAGLARLYLFGILPSDVIPLLCLQPLSVQDRRPAVREPRAAFSAARGARHTHLLDVLAVLRLGKSCQRELLPMALVPA